MRGWRVAVAIDRSHASLGEVAGAVTGSATVSLFDRSMMEHLKENQRIYLGVMLPNQLKVNLLGYSDGAIRMEYLQQIVFQL